MGKQDVHALSHRPLWGIITAGGVALLCWGLLACDTPKPHITMPSPKLYTDDQVLRTLAERRAAIREMTKGISTETLQEMLRVKQQTQTAITLSATAMGRPGSAASPPPLATLPDLAIPANLGLPAEGALRKRIALDQNITGYELLYLGNNTLLDRNRQAILLRIDVSINNFTKLKTPFGNPQFVIIGFGIEAGAVGSFSPQDVNVYTLEPEYTSVVGQESLLTAHMESYAAQASAPFQGATLTGNGSYQRGMEEGFLALIETPIQFAIYMDKPHRFGFAFGPRRRILKRSWINPYRIFGDTYTIEYQLEPGPRTVYALLTVPSTATDLRVISYVYDEFVPDEMVLTDKVRQPVKDQLEKAEPGQSQLSVCIPDASNPRCLALPLLKTIVPPVAAVTPLTLYTGVASQLFITSLDPVSSETDVFIGSLPIPKSYVTVLGRYRLKVSLPATKELDDHAKSTPCGTPGAAVPVFLVTPDRAVQDIGQVTFASKPC
jgi:hypothetical protein